MDITRELGHFPLKNIWEWNGTFQLFTQATARLVIVLVREINEERY